MVEPDLVRMHDVGEDDWVLKLLINSSEAARRPKRLSAFGSV